MTATDDFDIVSLGDGFTELDRRDVFFLVPPVIEIPDGPE